MRIVCGGNLLFSFSVVLQHELHVALSAGHPNLTDIHMLQANIADLQQYVLHRLLRRELQRKFARFNVLLAELPTVQPDRYHLCRITNASDADGSAAL